MNCYKSLFGVQVYVDISLVLSAFDMVNNTADFQPSDLLLNNSLLELIYFLCIIAMIF